MKSHYPIVELGRHVRQVSQRNRAGVDIEVFSVTNSEGFTRSTDYFSKEVFSKDVSNYKVVNSGQFAYNPSRINVGSIDYLRHTSSVLVSPLYVVFECGKGVYADYLLRYLRSDWGNAQIRAHTEGAVRDSLKFKGLQSIKIPLPSTDDQVRIAHLLGKVEELIAQRRQHLQRFDDLLKSIFFEMFGPNSPGHETWPLVEIRDLAAKHKGSMRTGPFGSNLLHSEFTSEGDVAVLGIDNAVQNHFAWDEKRFITKDKYQELTSYRVYPGDVIVTIMGTIGRSAVVPDDIPLAINTKHLAAITLNREVANPLFLSYSIHSSPFILKQLRSKNRGAIMNGLNLGIIRETKLKRPPIEWQNQFAETHLRVDGLKSLYLRSLAELETLYDALSQQAFKGELDLSRVMLPDERGRPTRSERDEQHEQDDRLPLFVESITSTEVVNSLVPAAQPDERSELVARWLKQYFTNTSSDVNLSSTQLLEWAWHALQENQLEAGEPTPALTLNDYDDLKELVFKKLASGELNQTFEEDSNRVSLQRHSEEWGAW